MHAAWTVAATQSMHWYTNSLHVLPMFPIAMSNNY